MSRRLLAITPVAHPGGAETTLLRLLAGLRGDGWTVTVTTPEPGPLRELIVRAGLTHATLPLGGIGRGQGLRAVGSFRAARTLADAADVVLLEGAVCGRLLPALVPPAPLPRTRARVVLHIHDVVPRVARLWHRADLVVAASRAVARSLSGLRAPVEVVHPPVDAEPPVAEAPWPAGEGPVIGFVGRFEPRKGPLDLVRAAPIIRRAAPAARIVLVGDEPYGTAPEYTREVLASPEIEHHRWLENAPGLMRHLDVLVLPAYREPFGTVLAEAMAVGTPVVATPVDGLPEVVDDGVTGRLVPPGDPERLGAAVLDVLAHRDEMGAAARAGAARFHTERHVAAMERLLAA